MSSPLSLCDQPFDLTDFDWSPELLIACHDSDEPNARLARHIWEDNGLDVVEVYAPALLKLLGKFVANILRVFYSNVTIGRA
jgi:hypothetical protein